MWVRTENIGTKLEIVFLSCYVGDRGKHDTTSSCRQTGPWVHKTLGFLASQSDLRIVEEDMQYLFLVEELLGSGFYRREVCQVNMEV